MALRSPRTWRRLAALAERTIPVTTNLCEGDRGGSNPRPSLEPQSAVTRFYRLPLLQNRHRYLASGTREMVAVAMDVDHAKLLTLLALTRLTGHSCHLSHLLGTSPARWCDDPGFRRRGSRRPFSGSGKDPSLVAFAYPPAWSPDPAPPSLSSAEGCYPGR